MKRSTVSASVAKRDEQREALVAEHPAQPAVVDARACPSKNALRELVEPPVLLVGVGLEQARAHHRRERERDDRRDARSRRSSVTANSRKRRPTMPAHEQDAG